MVVQIKKKGVCKSGKPLKIRREKIRRFEGEGSKEEKRKEGL
jgi:hypothetical protein